MESTSQKILIDPVDTKVLLTDVNDAEARTLDAAKHINYYGDKDKTTVTTYQGKFNVLLAKSCYPPKAMYHCWETKYYIEPIPYPQPQHFAPAIL